jgi:hypothetical protein
VQVNVSGGGVQLLGAVLDWALGHHLDPDHAEALAVAPSEAARRLRLAGRSLPAETKALAGGLGGTGALPAVKIGPAWIFVNNPGFAPGK